MLSQHGFNQLPLFFGGECFTVQKAGDAVMVDAPLQQIGKSCGGGLPKTCDEVVAVEFYHVFVHLFTLADYFFCYDSAFLKGCVTSDSNYDLNLKCHIILELDQQQIARSIRYEGKVCQFAYCIEL